MKTDVPRRLKPQVTRREAAGSPLFSEYFSEHQEKKVHRMGLEKKRGEIQPYLSLIGNFFVDTIFTFGNCHLFIEQ